MIDQIGKLNTTVWKTQKYEYADGDLVYKGANSNHGVIDNDPTWNIWKYTWDGDSLSLIEGPLVWTWTDRANAGWI